MATAIEDRVSRLEGAYDHLATKADMAELKGEFKADMAELKGELKADMAELKADMIKWMIGLMLASAGLASTIALLIQRLASG